jgi:hypothetical protein
MLYDKPMLLEPKGLLPEDPLWDIFIYMTQLRMVEKLAGADFAANPSKEVRGRIVNTLFPQMEVLEQKQRQKTIERVKEWTKSGPITGIVEIGLSGNRPKSGDDPLRSYGDVPRVDLSQYKGRRR